MVQRFLWLMKFSEKHKHLNLFCPKNGRAAIAFPYLTCVLFSKQILEIGNSGFEASCKVGRGFPVKNLFGKAGVG